MLVYMVPVVYFTVKICKRSKYFYFLKISMNTCNHLVGQQSSTIYPSEISVVFIHLLIFRSTKFINLWGLFNVGH